MSRTSSAFKVQLRVIRALLMREVITRYGRHNIGFLWLFVEPMIFTLGVATLWTLAGMHVHSAMPIIAFAITGYSSVLLWRNMPGRCVNAIEPNRALMYHRQVRVIDIFASRIVLELLGVTTSFAVLSLLFIGVGWMKPPADLFKVLAAWFLLAWFGAALGLFLGAMSASSELVEKFWHPAAYLLFPLSGAAFMVDWLPPAAQAAVLWIPMVHAVEYLRDGFFGHSVRTHYSLAYLGGTCFVLTAFALAQERIASRRVIPE